MTVQWSFGTSTLVSKFTPSRTIRPELIQSNSILMERVLPAEVRINPSRSGILEARGWSNTMMPIAPTLTRSISTQMEGTYSQVVPIQPLRFGILDKVISSIPSMVMRVLPPLLPSHHVEITLPLVDKTLLSWYGRVTLKKLSKSLLKTLEQSCNQENSQVSQKLSHQWHVQHQRLTRTLQLRPKSHPHQKNPSLELLLTWTMTTQQVSKMELVEVERNLPKLLRRL